MNGRLVAGIKAGDDIVARVLLVRINEVALKATPQGS